MDNAPEGERLKLNFTLVVQNIISKYSQCCQSSLIPDTEMSFLKAKGNPGLVYVASFLSAGKQGHNGDDKFSHLLSIKFVAEKQAPE